MAVTNPDSIDGIQINKQTGAALLLIRDDLGWSEKVEYAHLMALQNKVNLYVDFVESGRLFSEMPAAKKRPVEILVVFSHAPTAQGEEFFRVVNDILKDTDIRLSYRVEETEAQQ